VPRGGVLASEREWENVKKGKRAKEEKAGGN